MIGGGIPGWRAGRGERAGTKPAPGSHRARRTRPSPGLLAKAAALGLAVLAVPMPAMPQTRTTVRTADLQLPRVAWEGGPGYYAKFPRAAAAGWTDPTFFPIAVFYAKPEHAARLKALGVNTYMGAEHDGSALSDITRTGMFVIAQHEEWTPAEVGDDDSVVGWFVSDECDMGIGCRGGTAAENLADQTRKLEDIRGRKDGRFTQANFGNGVLGTFWARGTMAKLAQGVDVGSVDKYAYTSPHVRYVMEQSPFWPTGARTASSGAYGWLVDRLRSYADPRSPRPVWGFVETGRPLLTERNATVIRPAQIEGAVWAAIVHEARGIAYFQHSNDRTCPTYSLIDCDRARRDAVKALDGQVQALAPVLNTQSYVWDFRAGVDTMLKTRDGQAYVFTSVGVGHSPGRKTFRLPPGVGGATVTVVGENRTLPVTGGSFSDTFAAEWSHHVYRIDLKG